MEAKKALTIVKEMFDEGEVSLVDPKTLYRYSLMAPYPKDGENALVERDLTPPLATLWVRIPRLFQHTPAG